MTPQASGRANLLISLQLEHHEFAKLLIFLQLERQNGKKGILLSIGDFLCGCPTYAGRVIALQLLAYKIFRGTLGKCRFSRSGALV